MTATAAIVLAYSLRVVRFSTLLNIDIADGAAEDQGEAELRGDSNRPMANSTLIDASPPMPAQSPLMWQTRRGNVTVTIEIENEDESHR